MDWHRGHGQIGLTRGWGIAGLGWLVFCATGVGLFWQYKGTGQQPQPAAVVWPRNDELELDAIEPTLLMFAHPRCPCTRASMSELERVLRESGSSPRVTFVVYQPAAADATWQESPLLQEMRELPHANMVWDSEGKIAARFGAATSGQIQVYRPTGQCLFNGGVTRLRGHAGANAASDQLLAALQGTPAEFTTTTVYGCALQSSP
jgi:hypothetical protein